MFQMHQ